MISRIPLVTIIVPTFNNQLTIGACLESVSRQTYENFEVIVVDNFSTDWTREIAVRYGYPVVIHGNERCEQANFGVASANGEFILRMDADLVLDLTVLEECVAAALNGYDAVEVHNSPDPSISWIARARRFEYDLLRGDFRRISARFVRRELFLKVGGLNTSLIAGEDYDFQNRLTRIGTQTGFIEAQAISISEPVSVVRMMHKHFNYGRQSVQFRVMSQGEFSGQLDGRSVFQKLYLSKWRDYVRDPIGAGLFLIYLSLKVVSGTSGYLVELVSRRLSSISFIR